MQPPSGSFEGGAGLGLPAQGQVRLGHVPPLELMFPEAPHGRAHQRPLVRPVTRCCGLASGSTARKFLAWVYSTPLIGTWPVDIANSVGRMYASGVGDGQVRGRS